MGYTSIYELPAGTRIENKEIDALFDRIAISFIKNLAEHGLRYYIGDVSIGDVSMEKSSQGFKFTVTAEGTGFVDPEIFDRCFARAVLANLG